MTLVEQIFDALTKVQDPELRKPITELGMVEDLQEKNGAVSLTVLLTISACPMQDRLRNDVTTAITNVEGVASVNLTFGVMTEEQRNNVKKIVRGGREKFIPFAQPDSLTRVIGIASGKGGV
jgi:ATP-binding protein involved in chromosome partitioning